MKFKNSINGFTEEITGAWFWVLLFGCFYFAVKGVWPHALVGAILAVMTLGIS